MPDWQLTETEWAASRKENKDGHDKIFDVLETQNGRLRKMELWKARVEGMAAMLMVTAAAIGGIAGLVVTLIVTGGRGAQ